MPSWAYFEIKLRQLSELALAIRGWWNASDRPRMSSPRFRTLLARVLAWYLLWNQFLIQSWHYCGGVSTCKSDICWLQRSPFCPYNPGCFSETLLIPILLGGKGGQSQSRCARQPIQAYWRLFQALSGLYWKFSDHWTVGSACECHGRGPVYPLNCNEGDGAKSNKCIPSEWLITWPSSHLLQKKFWKN